MKTAIKNRRPFVSIAVLCVLAAAPAWAQVGAPAIVPPPATAASPASPSAAAAPAVLTDAGPAPKIVPPPVDAAVGGDMGDKPKSLSAVEDKVTDNAASVVKRLGSNENVTLDDLNSARQAVAKIEALIDIEKHLGELEKLRSEREGMHMPTTPTMAGAIPASALAPMQATPASLPMPSIPAMPASVVQNMVPAFSSIDVLRIIGTDGRYSAQVKTGDGQSKTIMVGDKLDGATVAAITATGVELDRDGVKHTLHVKNVQTVFGSAP